MSGPAPNPSGSLAEADARLYLHPQTLARLSTLDLRAKMIIEGVMSGAHRSPYQGFSVEFAQHRPYVPGDDIRHLDWKVFGRTDKLHLKQYQQETNLDLVLLVDSSGSMRFGSRLFAEASGAGRAIGPTGSPLWTKYDHATALAAALSYLALNQGDRAGLAVYADGVRAMVKRSSAQGTWRQIVGALATQPVERASDLGRVIDQELGALTNRCLIIIISDLIDDPDRIRAALAKVRHRGHDVILCRVLDRREREFDYADEAPFVGLEHEGTLRLDPRSVREAYLDALRAHIARVQRDALAFGFDSMLVNTDDWLGPPLAAFLARRHARLRRSKLG
ncbi:MAG: DUF58 domain-containing protein [Phycisphaerae bacterium]|nr:DUF58 domain-containing protein [Phycisphaerae bacterium]